MPFEKNSNFEKKIEEKKYSIFYYMLPQGFSRVPSKMSSHFGGDVWLAVANIYKKNINSVMLMEQLPLYKVDKVEYYFIGNIFRSGLRFVPVMKIQNKYTNIINQPRALFIRLSVEHKHKWASMIM